MSAQGILAATRLSQKDRSFKKEVIDMGVRALAGFNLTPKEKKDFIGGLTGVAPRGKKTLLPSRKTKGTGGVRWLFS